MFLKSSLSSTESQDRLPTQPSEAGVERYLLECVSTAFPDLSIASTRIENSGGDHVLLIADEKYAFRFPRPGQHALLHEIDVLHLLRQRTNMAVPAYEFIDPIGRFAGYQLIPGTPLSPAVFELLSNSARDAVLRAVGQLLHTLHTLDPAAIINREAWPCNWTAADFADRMRRQRLPRLNLALPALADAIGRFFELYRQDRPEESTVVHGDLVPEHILIDEDSSTLAGIIDFGDVALGDPAQDLAGLWAYGQEAGVRACQLYRQGETDPGLVARSRRHFIRYRIDSFYERLTDGTDRRMMEPEAAEIDALLSNPF